MYHMYVDDYHNISYFNILGVLYTLRYRTKNY